MANPQGTGFTNLQKLIGANQNNQLGNTIQSGVNKNISGLQNNVNQSQQQFNTDANNANQNTQANQQYAQGVIGNITNPTSGANSAAPQGQTPTPQVTDSSSVQQNQSATPTVTDTGSGSTSPSQNSGAGTGSGYAGAAWGAAPTLDNSTPGSFGTATSNATSGTNTTANTYAPAASDIQKFGSLLQGGYLGPNQLNNYQALQSQGQQLQSQGQNINSQGGLQSLLQQYVGGNNYNQGEQGLDTLILGQTGQPQLQGAANSLRGAANIPQSAEAQAQGLAQQIGAGNNQFAQGLQNAITSAQNPILQSIQQNINGLNQQNANQATIGTQLYNMLNNPNATAPAPGGLANHIGGGLASPTTDAGTAQEALQAALNSGAIDQNTYDTINGRIFATTANIGGLDQTLAPYQGDYFMQGPAYQNEVNTAIAQAQAGIGDPKTILAQMLNYNPKTAAPTYTLQQGANNQQAAQLNALAQLGGQQQQFGTYGAAAPTPTTFNTTNMPAAYSLDPTTINNDLTAWLGANHNGKA